MNSVKLFSISILILFFQSLNAQDIFQVLLQGNAQKAKELIEVDSFDVNIKNLRGFSAIHFAAATNLLDITKLLIQKGADPFVIGPFNRQPHHWAASRGSIETLQFLAKLGADLNIKDANEFSPLYLATTRGHKKTAEYLLEQGVYIQKEGRIGFQLLFFAIKQDIGKILNRYTGGDFNFHQFTADNSNLIMAAAQSGNTDLVDAFLRQSLNINHINDFGETALHLAIKADDLKMIKHLCEKGTDIHFTNFIGDNALDLASNLESNEVYNFLESKGAKLIPKMPNKGQYPYTKEPDLIPILFAPGMVSSPDYNERDVMLSPIMDELYFTRYAGPDHMRMRIKFMNKYDGSWSKPETAAFSGKFEECEVAISPDNKYMYYISRRNPDGSDNQSSWQVWVAERNGKKWENFNLMDTVNLKDCFYPSLTLDGELLYTGVGNDLYLADLNNNKLENIKKLGPEINTESGEYNAMISPKGDYIVFTSHGFEDHYGAGDLYISFRKEDNSWAQAINMGPEINTEFLEFCPNVSPDEKYFFFTSSKKGSEDIYWVSTKIIENLRIKVFGN